MAQQERPFVTQAEFDSRLPDLSRQVDQCLGRQHDLYLSRNPNIKDMLEQMMAWSKGYIQMFLMSRVDRADDLQRQELYHARELALQFFGENNHHFFVICIDGRNMPSVMLSHVPHIGGVMRTQAGELFGFIEATDGDVLVNPESFEAQSITRLLRAKPSNHHIQYSLDSHFGCAARGKIELTSSETTDGGMASDIRRKKAIARGIINIRKRMIESGEQDLAQIYPQFFSYDPHDGTLTMGLELHIDQVRENGFTPDTLNRLSENGQIISTGDFLKDQGVVTQLDALVKPADFRNHYAETMLSNWQAIIQLYDNEQGQVYQRIYSQIKNIYNKAGWKISAQLNFDTHKIPEDVLVNKSKVMLKNLVTRWSIARNTQNWPYDKHQEQGIVITEGGYAPFKGDLDVFSVFAYEDMVPMLDHLNLASGLVRDFRRTGAQKEQTHGGIKDPLGMLDGKEFINAPVIIMNKAILRQMEASGWSVLKALDLLGIFTQINWNDFSVQNWGKQDIAKLIHPNVIHQRSGDAELFIDGVYELFDRMRNMMFDYRFRDLLLSGKVMVVNLLVDRDRRSQLLVPLTV